LKEVDAAVAPLRLSVMQVRIDEERSMVIEPSKETPLVGGYDVVVAGAGPAGFGAAVAAARNGVRTLLLERYGFPGGMITAGLVTGYPLNLLTPAEGEDEPVIGGIAQELVAELEKEGASISAQEAKPLIGRCAGFALHMQSNAEWNKIVMLRMLETADVSLLMHSYVVDALVEGDTVKGVVVENKGGRQAFRAKVVVDATGDGDVAATAGAPYDQTRGQAVMPVTMTWYVANVDTPKAVEYLRGDPGFSMFLETHRDKVPPSFLQVREVLPTFKGSGRPILSLSYVTLPDFFARKYSQLVCPGLWRGWSPHFYGVDVTDPKQLSDAEVQARKDVGAILNLLREHVPGFEESYLTPGAMHIGIRESRRIEGEYKLTADDVLGGSRFDDVVVRSRTGEQIGKVDMWTQPMFDIPYRCLIPATLDGLIVAGRCISLTHEAASLLAPRDIVTCLALGQAAGTSAALSVEHQLRPRKLPISELQRTLRAQGARLGKLEKNP